MHRPLSVLVVDDDPAIVRSTVELLTWHRFRAAGSSNWMEALQLAIETRPDVVLVDLTMPELNGNEFALRLRRYLPHSPFLILMTEAGEGTGDMLAVETGFHLWITKPIDPENMLSVLDICARTKGLVALPDEPAIATAGNVARQYLQLPDVVPRSTP